ncbi:hypothetical protein E6R62_04515 [Streptomyces sp. A1136]|nr:hypothetical protein E6R62_04515 [Streptomyces sp. A1136]
MALHGGRGPGRVIDARRRGRGRGRGGRRCRRPGARGYCGPTGGQREQSRREQHGTGRVGAERHGVSRSCGGPTHKGRVIRLSARFDRGS